MMDVETVRALMAEQLDAARESAMAGYYGWSFEEKDLLVYVTMHPRRRADASYLARVLFDDFPRRAPSYVFVDRDTLEITLGGWPPNVKHGDVNELPGICTPGTREFHEKYHLNDGQYPWNSEKYSFLDTLQRIQKMMDAA